MNLQSELLVSESLNCLISLLPQPAVSAIVCTIAHALVRSTAEVLAQIMRQVLKQVHA